jgi:hypothetical protein
VSGPRSLTPAPATGAKQPPRRSGRAAGVQIALDPDGGEGTRHPRQSSST